MKLTIRDGATNETKAILPLDTFQVSAGEMVAYVKRGDIQTWDPHIVSLCNEGYMELSDIDYNSAPGVVLVFMRIPDGTSRELVMYDVSPE
jgi:hypothetical protein